MRVDVFFNRMAGKSNLLAIREGVRRALFRCEIRFWEPSDVAEFHAMIRQSLEAQQSDGLIFCGGDGTINTALRPLMEARERGIRLPTLSIIPVGTANDLAVGSGISRRIETAARALLEGRLRLIDVLEVRDEGDAVAYFITNGGLGLAALTAHEVNEWKKSFKLIARESISNPLGMSFSRQLLGGLGGALFSRVGARVYELSVARQFLRWNGRDWQVRVKLPGMEPFLSRSPLILVSNQPAIGGFFVTAPFTRNDDGRFNFLAVEPTHPASVLNAILAMRQGVAPRSAGVVRAETSEVEIEAVKGARSLLFFGDGEVLFEKARKLRIRCIHQGIPLVEQRRDRARLSAP